MVGLKNGLDVGYLSEMDLPVIYGCGWPHTERFNLASANSYKIWCKSISTKPKEKIMSCEDTVFVLMDWMAVRASIKAWNTRCIFSNDLIHLVNTRRAFWLQIRASRGYYLFLMVVLVLCWCCAIMEIVSLNLIISGRNSYYKIQSPMTVSALSL